MESEEEAWDQTRSNSWDYKRDEGSECAYLSSFCRLKVKVVNYCRLIILLKGLLFSSQF